MLHKYTCQTNAALVSKNYMRPIALLRFPVTIR
jgi:hypothetical protein